MKIFYKPDEAFKEIKEKKPLGVPILILIVISLIISFLYIQFVVLPNKEAILMARDVPQEAMQKALEFIGSPLYYVSILLAGIIGFIAATLIIGFIYYLVSTILKGKSDFMAFWSSTVHIYAINILGSIIALPIAIAKGSPKVNLDFSLFFMFLSEKNFLRIFLEHAGFFTLWAVFLYGLALHHIGEMEKKKGIITSFILWFIYALIATVIGVIKG